MSSSIRHWLENNNCITRENISNEILNLVKEDPLWDADKLSLNIYNKEIRKLLKMYKLRSLKFEDEQHLIILKCNGDTQAYQKLIYSQLPFVISIARKYQNLGLSLNDLISEGNLGLIEAIGKIEPRGFRVSSYTKWYINYRIQTAIVNYGTQIHFPMNIVSKIRKIQKFIIRFELKNGYQPSIEDISNNNIEDINLVENSIGYINSVISIEQLYRYFKEENTTEVFISSSQNPIYNLATIKIDDELYYESIKKDINSMICKLYEREQKIIRMFFGINGKEMDLEKIAIELNLTRERVRQIKEKAIRRLKGIKSAILKGYLG